MATDPAMGLVVLVFAMFGLPRLMSAMPDFDPLMMIVAAFAILALLQHLGVVNAPEGGVGGGGPGGPSGRDDEGPRRSGGVGRPSNGGRDSSSKGGAEGSGRGKRDAECNVKDLMKEAEQCFQQNSWSAVQEITGKVVNRDPENARAWELLALSQKWDGKREEAAATVKKARELYEVESKGLAALAKELAGAHDSSAASAENGKRGEDFLAKRQYDLAMECFNKAIDELDDAPTGSDSSGSAVKLRRHRCECAQQLHDFSQCRRDATYILERDPNDTKALLQRAISNEGLEKFSAALEDARKLLMLDPANKTIANRIINNCRKAM